MPPRKPVARPQQDKKKAEAVQPSASLLPRNRSAKRSVQMINSLTVRGETIKRGPE